MSNYTQSTNFATKDALPSGDPLKIVKGTEINTEFNNIAVAVATKADLVSPTFTGTPALPTGTTAVTQSAGNSTTAVATTAFVGAAITAFDTALTVSTAQIEDVAVTTAKIAANAVTNAKLASGVAVANLGFTPVQQGTGTGQLSNAVKIGWDGGALRLEVDATNFGSEWPLASRNGNKAWVNFNGTGTVAIRASNNVSSITDNGTGDYTVNFTTAMPDANYAVSGLCQRPDTNNDIALTIPYASLGGAYSTTAVRLVTTTMSASWPGIDASIVTVSIFR